MNDHDFQPPPPNPPGSNAVNDLVICQVDWGTPPDPGGETSHSQTFAFNDHE